MNYLVRDFPQELHGEMEVIPPDDPDVGPSVPELLLGINDSFDYLA
jgi:hypothetical protein